MQLIGGGDKRSVYNLNGFSVHLHEQPHLQELWNRRNKGVQVDSASECLNGRGGVARDDWVSAGNETAPLPAFSTATQKTNIASCVTNEPALTSPPDL